MHPRNQAVKGQGELGHLPFPMQAAWKCSAKRCILKYLNPELSVGCAFKNDMTGERRHPRATEKRARKSGIAASLK